MTYRIYYDGTMTVIAVIEQPAVIRQILDHLGLPTGAASLRAPPARLGAGWVISRASGPTTRPLTCLCVTRRQATSPAPLLPSHSGKADGLVCPARRRARSGPRNSA